MLYENEIAAKDPSVKILGVTVLAVNVDLDQSTRNALAALELAGSNAPVYRGSSEKYDGEPIEAASVYGKDGMGDAGLVNPRGEEQQLDAVDFIVEAAREHSGEVGSFVAKSFVALRELYASNGAGGTTDCDALAMTCALQPDFVTDTAKYHGSCIIDKGETYGQVIFYKEGMTYD